MSKVSEVMNTEVLSVRSSDVLEEVVKIFKENNVSGLPVVDSDNKIIGVISDRDLIKYSENLQIIPLTYLSGWIYPYEYFPDKEEHKVSAETFLKTHVFDVMSKKVISIKESNSLHDAVLLMKKKGVNRLPVVDSDGILKGIITRTDLLNFLAEHKILV